MREDLELKLQEEFPFMRQNHVPEERNLYRSWGCECSSGWYGLIHDCCKEIMEKYEEYGVEIDFVPAQIKEKFGTLRFYYGYEDAPCGIAAFDCIGNGTSIRFAQEAGVDERNKLRKEIAEIVRKAEKRSETTCECCGATDTARLRTDLGGVVLTLCNLCCDKYAKKREENQKKHREKMNAIYEKLINKKTD